MKKAEKQKTVAPTATATKAAVKSAKPEVTVEPPVERYVKIPIEDNLGDNWLLRRFVNRFLALGDRRLKAKLVNETNWAGVKAAYLANGGTEEKIRAHFDALLEFYGK